MIAFSGTVKLVVTLEFFPEVQGQSVEATCLYQYADPRNPAAGLELIQVSAYGQSLNPLLNDSLKRAILGILETDHEEKVRAARESWNRARPAPSDAPGGRGNGGSQ